MRNIAFFVIAINLIALNVLKADDVVPPQANPNENLTQEYFAHISDISGTWNPVSLNYGSPSLVNLAHTIGKTQTISFTFFPMEYCQAVRICTSPNQEFGVEDPFTVNGTMCDKYIDYSPATGKFQYFVNGKMNLEGFVHDFTFISVKNEHKLQYSTKPFYRTNDYKSELKKMNLLEDKLLIVMSNSRQCQTNIIIDGKLEYSDLLIRDRIKEKTKMPAFFHYGGSIDALPTFYTETSSGKKRAQDLLPHLKSLTKTSKNLKNIEFKCLIGFGIGNGFPPIYKPSIIQVTKNKMVPTSSGDSLKIERVLIEMEQCHWLRLWFTAVDTKWEKYAATIGGEIHQTIDLFFEEGFAFLPDRESSIILPGGSKKTESIGIYHHGDGLAEISFGSVGNKRVNSLHFHMDILKQDAFEIFLIRSPHCDANFGSDFVGTGMFAIEERVWNPVFFKECNVYSIEKP